VINYLMDFFIVFLAVLAALFIVVAYKAHKDSQKPDYEDAKPNNGNKPSHPHKVIGREKELRRLVRQILRGESGAIIGSARSGKTLMLDYLRDENPEHQAMLYGDKADRLIFSYLDISALETGCNPAKFWEEALKAIEYKIITGDVSSALSNTYRICQDKQFDNFYLDKLLAQLRIDDWQLVLMLDRFESLLPREHLNTLYFLGHLRTLVSSRADSPLTLIIAGKNSLNQFHKETKDLNPMGSPYLNFLESGEIILGALSDAEIDSLLQQSDHTFTEDDRHFIKEMAGGHPYLVQVAATILWEAYENKEPEPLASAEKTFYSKAKNALNNFLQSWAQSTTQAFLAVARQQDVSRFNRELKELEEQGFVKQDKENGKWQVRARVFSDFVFDGAYANAN